MIWITHTSLWDWGGIIRYMHRDGIASAELRYFDDSPDYMVLGWLNVSEEARNKGLGLELQLLREDEARKRGCKWVYLTVKKGTWMRKWYARRGYKWYNRHETESSFMWLRKRLNK